MDKQIKKLFKDYAAAIGRIETIRAEVPELEDAEREANALKAQIQDWAKTNSQDAAWAGFQVKLSTRETWDTKRLAGFVVAHPELEELRRTTVVASVSEVK